MPIGSTLLIVSAFAVFVGSASAFCPEPKQQVSSEFFTSDAVFTGTVQTERTVPEKGSTYDGWVYRLRIREKFRGSVRDTTEVFTEHTSGRFPLVVGETYLLFAYMDDGQLTITNCGNSGFLLQINDLIPQIRKIKSSEEIAIKEAAAEAVRLGYVIEAMSMSVKTPWDTVLSRNDTDAYTVEKRNKLSGREYFEVYFAPKRIDMKGGDIAVFVDAHSGKVLTSYRGK
jgi:hypothetical protein